MKKSKKLLSIILTLGIVLSLLPTTALAVIAPVSGEGWSLDSFGKLTISSDTGMSGWLDNKTTLHIYVSSLVIGDAVTFIPDYGFYTCWNANVVTIGNGVTTIGDYAFQADNITSLTFGSSIKTIGAHAFDDTTITSLSLPNSLTEIGEYAFYSCDGITSALSIPDSVTKIGAYAFDDCRSIPSVTLPDNNTSIGTYAFCYCYDITSVTIPNAATSIGPYAFCYCSGITSLTLPDGMTSIDDYAFSGLGNNLNLTIPDTVTEIGEGAFKGCYLASVTIPDSVKIIGDSALSGTGLSSVSIPASVITIDANAFDECSIVFFEGATPPTTVGTNAFAGSSILYKIYVPAGSVDSYKSALSDYADYIVEIQAAITKAGVTTYYTTLEDALAAAADGDTVTLLTSITDSITYTVTTDKTITLDGKGNSLTSVRDPALELGGEGTIVLKDITLYGSTETNDNAYGLLVSSYDEKTKVLNVLSSGIVNIEVNSPELRGNIYGLLNYSAGTVNITNVNCTAVDSRVYGIDNEGTGTVNVKSVTVSGGKNFVTGVYNNDIGTVNVMTATVNATATAYYSYGVGVENDGEGTINVTSASGDRTGAHNYGTGIVNVATATGGSYGVYNEYIGVVNVATATGGIYDVYNGDIGVVNVATATGGTAAIDNNWGGTVNTGTDVAQLTLNAGSGAICVLNSITVAAATGVSTTIGALPSVYRNGAYSSDWYTVSASLFSGTTVAGATTLYSSLYTPDPAIDTAAISGVTAPVNGGVPTSTIADTTEYTATISWSPTASTFAASTAYTATITIVPKIGYTLTGVTAGFFKVAGAVATNTADSGVVTAVFPATAADTIINTPAIAGVTAPVKGATPTSTIADTTEYTATISWLPADATFAPSTVYTATITMTPKAGYTLTGVAENFFTVAGAVATNDADSSVVTAVFPATAAIVINTPAIAGVTAPVKDATPTSSITDTTEYTATITWSPTASTFAESTAYTATITITPKTGYTLTGVGANFFTVAGATATNAADSGVVKAVFPATASSGGTGGSGSVPGGSEITSSTAGGVTTGTASLTGSTSGGNQTVSVLSTTMTSLTKAVQEAETAGNLAIAQIDTGSGTGLKNVGVTIPGTQFDSFASGTDAALRLTTGIGSVTFSADAVDAIDAAGSGNVTFGIRTVDTSTLTDEQQATVGNRSVYSFSVTVGATTVSEFGATVTVSLPYTLQDGESPNAIVVYYVDASGDLQLMQGAYDETTGMVTFKTSHFSDYVIGYNEVTFTDVAETAWCNDAVTFLAARGVTTGTTATTFGPNAKLTRGQFITLLLRAYGVEADANSTDNFIDAGDTYYTGYLAAAKRLGISGGIGNNKFAPDRTITRQEMFTLLYNALKAIDQLPEADSGKTLSDFTDSQNISSYAQEAMAFLVETSVVAGNNGKLSPTETTTRAQMARVLYNILSKQ